MHKSDTRRTVAWKKQHMLHGRQCTQLHTDRQLVLLHGKTIRTQNNQVSCRNPNPWKKIPGWFCETLLLYNTRKFLPGKKRKKTVKNLIWSLATQTNSFSNAKITKNEQQKHVHQLNILGEMKKSWRERNLKINKSKPTNKKPFHTTVQQRKTKSTKNIPNENPQKYKRKSLIPAAQPGLGTRTLQSRQNSKAAKIIFVGRKNIFPY